MTNIAVVGLGKLGYPLAAFWASQGHQVLGCDSNPYIQAAIQRLRTQEPGLDGLEDAGRLKHGLLAVMGATAVAVAHSEFTFIIVPTPTDHLTGRFSMEYVLRAAEDIGKGLAKCKEFHVVVLVSTVMPGDTEALLIPALEKHSGKKCGQDFGVCYNPEFVALGDVVKGMTKPDLILIGESDDRSGLELQGLYTSGVDSPLRRMSVINAEIAKLSLNCYITMKITWANQLAEICEGVPGADADVITDALGCDTRIGRRYLKGGMGFGGPCFPRDNRAFQVFAHQHGGHAMLSRAVEVINDRQAPRIAALAAQKYRRRPGPTYVAVLGLSYKPGTPVVEESQSLAVVDWLVQSGVPCRIHDPLVRAEDLFERLTKWNRVEKLVEYDGYLEQVVRGASVVVMMLPLKEYDDIKPEWFGLTRKPFIDCWRFRPDLAAVTDYYGIGLGKKAGDATS